jgi:hypothetical protein
MEPITAAVMLILGCDHSMMVCREVPEPAPHYASVEACEADKDMRVRFVDFPVAVTDCVAVPGLAPGEKVVIDWRLDAVGNLLADAELRDSAPMTAEATADAPTLVASAGGM